MKRHTLAAGSVVFAIAAGLFTAAAASGQTLGEVAKKEAERRKAQPQGGKVYTNKDLPASAQKPATTNPSTDTAAQTPTDPVAAATEQKAEDAKTAADKPQDDQKDQAYWKGRMAAAREELRRSEMFAEALQTRVNTLNKDFNSRDNPAQRSAIGADRTEALNELTRVKQDVERGKKQIADIEEEARKAGVPPGWVR
jgi:archaellum component FlaC